MAAEAQTAFISYSREDSEFALKLAGDLKAAGAVVWLDQLDIAPGARWARAVEEALAACPRMLVILSPSSAGSTNVDDEVSFALEEKKAVIPVLYRDCKIPFRLRPFQFVDFRGDYDLALKRLLRTLPTGLTLPQVAPVQKEPAPAVSTQAPAEPTAESEQAQKPVGDLPPTEPEIVPAAEQILPDVSEEPRGDHLAEPEHTEIVEFEQIEEENETSKEQAREEAPAIHPVVSNAERVETQQTEDEKQSPREQVAEEESTIPPEEGVQSVAPEEVHAESSAATAEREPETKEAPAQSEPESVQATVPAAPMFARSVQDDINLSRAEATVASVPPELTGEASPIPVEPVHDQSESVGDESISRSPLARFSVFPARVKVAAVACGILVLCVILYWVWTASHSGWRRQTSGVTETLISVDFATPESGWAVGDKGVILHTENKGQTWKRQNSGSNEDLRSVVFTSPQLGWAVSNSGSILHTADGGETWTKQVSPSIEVPTSVAFLTPESGWVVDHGGRILHTANGGNTWEAQTSGVNTILSSITFVSAQSGWVVGNRGVILHTENGGVTWTKQISGTDKELNSVSFATAQLGWAVGEDGIILHTEDGGGTWTTQVTGARTKYLACVVFPTPQLGWAAGYEDGMGIIVHTADGGATWKKQASGMKSWPLWLTFPTPQSGWAVGLDGTILHWEE